MSENFDLWYLSGTWNSNSSTLVPIERAISINVFVSAQPEEPMHHYYLVSFLLCSIVATVPWIESSFIFQFQQFQAPNLVNYLVLGTLSSSGSRPWSCSLSRSRTWAGSSFLFKSKLDAHWTLGVCGIISRHCQNACWMRWRDERRRRSGILLKNDQSVLVLFRQVCKEIVERIAHVNFLWMEMWDENSTSKKHHPNAQPPSPSKNLFIKIV